MRDAMFMIMIIPSAFAARHTPLMSILKRMFASMLMLMWNVIAKRLQCMDGCDKNGKQMKNTYISSGFVIVQIHFLA